MEGARSRLQRTWIMAFAIGTTVVLGVRSPRSQASPWEHASFEGDARAALVVEAISGEDGEALPVTTEVFAKATYGTSVSRFRRGLLLRTAFPVPGTGDSAVLRIDLDRRRSRERWDATDDRYIDGRFYVVIPDSGVTFFDGRAVSGELELNEIVATSSLIAFRIRGWLDFVDDGPDLQPGTGDDLRTSIEIAIETIPPPEEIDPGVEGTSPLPAVAICEWPRCYEDPGYVYDPYYGDAACGQATTGYEYDDQADGTGCEGDPVTDDGIYDAPVYTDDGFTPVDIDGDGDGDGDVTSSSGGCEGDTYDDSGDTSSGCGSGDSGYGDSSGGASSSGCDGDGSSSGDGCGGGGDGGGCGGGGDGGCGSGCEGDSLSAARPPGARALRLGGVLGWASPLLLFSFVVAIHRRRP